MEAKIGNRLMASLKPREKYYQVHDTELRRFYVRVQPSGEIFYAVDVRLPSGKRTRIGIGKHGVFTPAQARDEAKKILGDIARGLDPVAARRADAKIRFIEFVEHHYGPWVLVNRKSGKDTFRQLKSSVHADFHDKRLEEFNPWIAEKWRLKQKNFGKKTSSINRDLFRLKATLSKAVEWGFLKQHPLSTVKPQEVDDRAKPRFLSPEEESRLRNALDVREVELIQSRKNANLWRRERAYEEFPSLEDRAYADYLKPMVLLSLNTGLRRGSLFSLLKKNVDLVRRSLSVPGLSMKGGKTIHIPLNDEALLVLKKWIDQSDPEQELVFCNDNGQRFDNVKKSWTALRERARLEHFRWHDMRHHFASRLVMEGVDLNTVRELLGHSDLKITLIYAHLAPHVKAEAVAKLGRPRKREENDGSEEENQSRNYIS